MMDLPAKQSKETTMTQDATLKRIYRILFGYVGNTTTAAADRNLLKAIENFKAITEVGLVADPCYAYELMNMVQQSTLLATLGRVHDQLQDVRNILKAEGYQ